MGERLRITLSDKRVVEGTLECYDGEMNLILTDCDQEGANRLGTVMVPGKHVVKVEIKGQ